MPKLIALEWDASEARVVVARHRGPEVVLEQGFTVDLRPREGEPAGESRVGERLAAALSARAVGKGDVLVAVGRANIELRPLSLPPAPEEEFPDLVRFQAMRQFSNVGEDWPLDFIPLATATDAQSESRSVLAAAISPELVSQIQEQCAQADLKPKRLILRPFAAASLLVRRHPQEQGCRLLVDWLADEVDLTVLIGEHVIFPRTVRLPAVDDPSQQAQALIREIRRTMAAAQNQLGGRGVESIVLCGQEEAPPDEDPDASSTQERTNRYEVKTQIEEALSLPVIWLNPLDGFELDDELLKRRPRRPGRFAPLCGMVLDEAYGGAHAIDFLHPRKAAPPPNPKRKLAIWGGILAATAAAIFLMMFVRLKMLDAEIADLKAASKALDKPVESARKLQASVAAVDAVVESDVSWIDEMRHLSRSLPPSDKVMLTRLEVKTKPRPAIVLDGQAMQRADVDQLENELRDDRHTVTNKALTEDLKSNSYRWRFSETVDIQTAVDLPTFVPPETKATATAEGELQASPSQAGAARSSPASRRAASSQQRRRPAPAAKSQEVNR